MRRLHGTLVGLTLVWLAGFAQAGVTASCVIDPAYRTGTTLTAPAFVAIECTGSTHTDPDVRPFHDLRFSLSYNDSLCSSGTGTWANSDSDAAKNSDVSPVGGHIYECAGTYQMTATVCDSVGDCDTWTSASFTVQSEDAGYPGTLTKCVSTSSNFTGCPTGATQTTSSDYDASLLLTAGTRTLFRCGETFMASTNPVTSDSTSNNSLIGSYGTQPCEATVALSYAGDLHSWLSAWAGTNFGLRIAGWKVRDVVYDARGFTSAANDKVWHVWDGDNGTTKPNVMLLRVISLGVWACPTIGNPGMSAHVNARGAMVSTHCVADDPGTTSTIWYLLTDSSLLNGLYVDNLWEARRPSASGSGAMRLYYHEKTLFSHNRIVGSGSANLAIHFRESQGASGLVSQHVIFSDTRIEDSSTEAGWTIALWRQCGGSCAPPNDVAGHDYIFESNRFTYGANASRASSVQMIINNEKSAVTIRNNIVDWRTFSGSGENLDAFGASGHSYLPNDVRIYNNTIIRAGSTTAHVYACFDPGGLREGCRNNLIYDVNDTDDSAYTVSGSFDLVGQNLHQHTSSCPFYGASGSCELIGDCTAGTSVDFNCFKLRTSGGGVGSVKDAGFVFPETTAGYADYVYRDAFGGCRGGSTGGPDGLWDIGAHERSSTDCLTTQSSPGVFRGAVVRGAVFR